MDLRQERKYKHIEHSLSIEDGPLSPGFLDVQLIHQALPAFNLKDVDTSLTLFQKNLSFPLIINAMTGGAEGLERYNKLFSLTAKECGVALAVGSQTAAIKDPKMKYTFQIARKYNPEGILIANLSALSKPNEALEAVEMLAADALQLHLNLAQELAMLEGDRCFQNVLENILQIKDQLNIPIIIKEVGFGLSKETVALLYQHGFTNFDLGGTGGTNFAAIEQKRNPQYTNPDLIHWGIPTVVSLLETKSIHEHLHIYATGGLRSARDIVVSLALGAKMVGMATPFLVKAQNFQLKESIAYLQKLIKEVKELMFLINAKNLEELRKVPVVITGFVEQWLNQRGIKY